MKRTSTEKAQNSWEIVLCKYQKIKCEKAKALRRNMTSHECKLRYASK